MGLRLIRQKSDMPNVQSSDDARMVRYAYGGCDGVVKNRGTECSHTISGTTFKINSGVIVLQGWEVEIDSNGWSLSVDSLTKYYAVYLEVNLATDTAEIKSTYDTAGVPSISLGDDLTQITNGIARLVLYTFKSTNSVISDVIKKVSVIGYTAININELREDLESGALVVAKASAADTQTATDSSTKIATTAFVQNLFTAKKIYVHSGWCYFPFRNPKLPDILTAFYYFLSTDKNAYSSISEFYSAMPIRCPCWGGSSYLLSGTTYQVIPLYFEKSSGTVKVNALCLNNNIKEANSITEIHDTVSEFNLQ